LLYISISDVHPSAVVPHNSEPLTHFREQTAGDIYTYDSYVFIIFHSLIIFAPGRGTH
jgi:hypothetical protein